MINIKFPPEPIFDQPEYDQRYKREEFTEIIVDRVFNAVASADKPIIGMHDISVIELRPTNMIGYMVNGTFVARTGLDQEGFYLLETFKGVPGLEEVMKKNKQH